MDIVKSEVLKLMDNNVKESNNTSQTLDGKAQLAITISSITITLLTAFHLSQPQLSPSRQLFLPVLLIVYLITVLCAFDALFPKKWTGGPLKADWTEGIKVSGMKEEDYFNWVLNAYIETIEGNRPVLIHKSKRVKQAMLGIFFQITLIILAALFLP